MIAPRTSIADRPHYVLLQNPGPPVADGGGGWTNTWSDLSPASVFAKISPATAEELERVAAGGAAVESTATHIVAMPYHPQVTTKTRIIHSGRTFEVLGVSSPDERQQETIAVCTEVVA